MVNHMPKRDEVKTEETWNLNDLFQTENDFSGALKEIEQNALEFNNRYHGNIQNATDVVGALIEYTKLYEKIV
ncbi:MAG: oligoendopeptidase F, partial [Psychrobacillus psychrotolerans]